MIRAPMPCSAWSLATPSATVRSASMSRPESVSSSTATCGSSIAICRISARFFSPPENPSLSGREVNERSTSSRSAACWSFWPNSLTRIGSSLRPVLMAMRRKFAIDTPGIATGYWKARKRPAWARASGSASGMSSPLKVIVPSVISYSGWPMIVEASVDFPEPFGPISACSSPFETDRSTPLRISRSSTRTCRLRISRSANGFSYAALLGNKFGKCGVLQRAHDREAHAGPQQLGGAGVVRVGLARADDRAVGIGADALDRGDAALERLDDLGHRDLVGRAGQKVAAARAAPALDEPGLAQPRDEVLEIGERQAVGLRHLGQRDWAGAAPGRELHEDPHAVLRLGREHHLRLKPTCGVGYQRGQAPSRRRSCASPSGVISSARKPIRWRPVRSSTTVDGVWSKRGPWGWTPNCRQTGASCARVPRAKRARPVRPCRARKRLAASGVSPRGAALAATTGTARRRASGAPRDWAGAGGHVARQDV